MSRRKKPESKKRRTREHVIADLSVNHVERQALLCNYSVQRIGQDYGIDLRVYTYNRDGEVENGEIMFQLKATDHLKVVAAGTEIAFRLERAHLRVWVHEVMPVIVVVYDAVAEVGYWLYVQAFFEEQPSFNPAKGPAQVTVRTSRQNVLNQAAMKHFAHCRDLVLTQWRKRVRHEEENPL